MMRPLFACQAGRSCWRIGSLASQRLCAVGFMAPAMSVAASPAMSSVAVPVMRTPRAMPTASPRSFSMMPQRAYPQYSIYGGSTCLSVKTIMPSFKRAGGMDGISVDQRGRLLLEFIPRSLTGAGFLWQQKVTFRLSVEETGLILSQLPEHAVELSHLATPTSSAHGEEPALDEVMHKVVSFTPGEGKSVAVKIDLIKDGTGGHSLPDADQTFPMEIEIQAGEFQVLKSIFQTSIPYLLGWNTTLDIASANAISRGLSNPSSTGYNQ